MRAKEFLIEGSGLRAAKSGEIYVDPNGEEYKFQNWNWQHPSNADAFQDLEDMHLGILDVTAGDKNKIAWVNSPTNRSKSFAYAVFRSEKNQELWIGKFYEKKNPNNTILDKEVKAVLGLSAGGKTSTIKTTASLQPGQLGLADNRARNVNSIVNVLKDNKQGPMLVNAISNINRGQDVIFKDGAPIIPALQDDFCEILAPIAMINKHSVVTGQLDIAVRDVFKGDTLSGALISFPSGQNNPLVDSYIVKNGISLGVSHKGKQGAKATITNIWKAKEEAANTKTGASYLKKFKEAVYILDTCKEQSGLEQPITLGLRYNLISSKEANKLYSIISTPREPAYQLTGHPSNPTAVIKIPTKEDLKKVPSELMRLFKMGGYKSGSYVSFLCLARVAHLVAQHINSDKKIDFGEAIRSFLNSSAMVQAKSIVSSNGNDAVLKNINVVYPPNFQEKAKIESNGYSGTQVKGKFSFSLPST